MSQWGTHLWLQTEPPIMWDSQKLADPKVTRPCWGLTGWEALESRCLSLSLPHTYAHVHFHIACTLSITQTLFNFFHSWVRAIIKNRYVCKRITIIFWSFSNLMIKFTSCVVPCVHVINLPMNNSIHSDDLIVFYEMQQWIHWLFLLTFNMPLDASCPFLSLS